MNFLKSYSSRFRILKGGKISLVVSALLTSATINAVAAGPNYLDNSIIINSNTSSTISGTIVSDTSIEITSTGEMDVDSVSEESAIEVNISSDADLTITNDGLIDVNALGGEDSIGINLSSSYSSDSIVTINNNGDIVSKSISDSAVGISYAYGSASALDLNIVNDGLVDIEASEYGVGIAIEEIISSSSILNRDEITVESDNNAYGIYSYFNSGNIINSGIISTSSNSTSSNNDSSGINFGHNNGTIINDGDIQVYSEAGSATGISSGNGEDNSGTIINTGTIRTHSQSDSSIAISSSSNHGTITNDGNIYSFSSEGYAGGILIENNAGTVTNNGDIYVNSTEDLADGIYIDGNNTGTIINNGTIDVAINNQYDDDAWSIYVYSNSDEGKVINNGNLYGNLDIDGDFENNGKVSLPYNATSHVENFKNSSTSILEVALYTDGTTSGEDSNPNMTYTKIYADSVIFEPGSKIAVNVLESSENEKLLVGEKMEDVILASTIDIQGDLSVEDNSALLDFEHEYNDGGGEVGEDSLSINIVEGSTIYDSTVAGGGDTPAKKNAKLLEDFKNQNNGMDDFVSKLNKCTTDECVAKEVDALETKLLRAGYGAAKQTAQAITKIVRQRQDLGFSSGGLNSGDSILSEKNVWFKPFGSWGKQENKDGLNGFDIKSYGFGLGADGKTKDEQQYGIAFFYTNADIDVNNADQSADIDGYTLLTYGSIPVIDSTTKFLYQLGYSWQRTDTYRDTLLGTANGDFTSKVASLDLKLMKDYKLSEKWLLQPTVGTTYTHFTTPSYSEGGAGVASLDVNKFTTTELLVGIGTTSNFKIDDSSTFIATVDLNYDLHDKQDAVSSSTAGGLVLADSESIDNGRLSYAIGVGYKKDLTYNSNINISYEYEGEGSSYHTNTVSLKYVLKF